METPSKLIVRVDEVPEEPASVTEEAAAIEPEEETAEGSLEEEPVVEVRQVTPPEDVIVVEPNITAGMIEAEKDVYNAFRNYILNEEIYSLDRYASGHRSSVYHAAALFALAEMHYRRGTMKEMTIKAYEDIIRAYPLSKYASYASHRIEQLERDLPYAARDLRFYTIRFDLPPITDYRELEPYKK
jgi:hypothetical protein